MNAQAKAEIMALADTITIEDALAANESYLRRRDREAWATLDDWQREQYRLEAFHLHRTCHLPARVAVSTVRRMIRIGSWK